MFSTTAINTNYNLFDPYFAFFGTTILRNWSKVSNIFLFMLITNKGSSYKIFKFVDFIIGDVVQIGTSVHRGK